MSAEARERISKAAPLLLGALVACNFAAGGLTSTLADPPFELLLHVMLFVAVGTSALAIIWNRSSSWLGAIIVLASVATLPARVMSPSAFGQPLVSAEAMGDPDLMMATMLAWLMVGFCFMLSARRNVIFCLVTGLGMFGLVSTVNLNAVMLLYFAVMIFASVFVWGYEHLLNLEEGSVKGRRRVGVVRKSRDWARIARTQALAGTLLVAPVIAVGLLVGTALYTVGPRLYLNPGGMYNYSRWIQISLLSYGGMLNSFYVGRGPVNLPGVPAMEIKADKGALWRGQAYDYYTGRGWNNNTERMVEIPTGGEWSHVPGTEQLVGERLVQKVRVTGIRSRALFAAARPVAVRMPPQSIARHNIHYRIELDAYGCLITRFVMQPGVEYEIVSVMPPSDAETLRACPTRYPPRIVESCVKQVTPGALAALEGIVAEVTAGAATPYDKVVALRDYIEHECVYSARAPAIPSREDAAAYFVTRSKTGACDLFATSLAVMCRIAGVPARVVTGFMTGTWQEDKQAFVPLQRDAHAWTEVYFPGVGWTPFDAAAERVASGEEYVLPVTLAQLRRRLGAAAEKFTGALLVIAGVAAIVSALLGPGVFIRWLRARLTPKPTRERMSEILRWFARRASRMAGMRAERWRTPRELCQALVAAGLAGAPSTRERLERFTDMFCAQRYGRREPSKGQARRMAKQARETLRVLRRKSVASKDQN